ncbi:uncharacterized protein VSU04_016015 isoform 3-T3 [Chlamydotis macqueenii]
MRAVAAGREQRACESIPGPANAGAWSGQPRQREAASKSAVLRNSSNHRKTALSCSGTRASYLLFFRPSEMPPMEGRDIVLPLLCATRGWLPPRSGRVPAAAETAREDQEERRVTPRARKGDVLVASRDLWVTLGRLRNVGLSLLSEAALRPLACLTILRVPKQLPN